MKKHFFDLVVNILTDSYSTGEEFETAVNVVIDILLEHGDPLKGWSEGMLHQVLEEIKGKEFQVSVVRRSVISSLFLYFNHNDVLSIVYTKDLFRAPERLNYGKF